MERVIDEERFIGNLQKILQCWCISPVVSDEECRGARDMLNQVISEVREAPILSPTNKTITEEQLKKMVGEPIWIQNVQYKEWMLLLGYDLPDMYKGTFVFARFTGQRVQFSSCTLHVTWLAYRRPPEGAGNA